MLSQGVPMLLGGDEIGRTQQGNNNAWCQDNELSWFDWELGAEHADLLAFAAALHRPAPRSTRSSAARASSRARARLGAARRVVVPPRGPQA